MEAIKLKLKYLRHRFYAECPLAYENMNEHDMPTLIS